MSRVTRARLVAVAAICVGVLAGGIAYGSIPDSSDVLHGCYKTKGGQLRVIDTAAPKPADAVCKKNETGLAWSGARERGRFVHAAVGSTVDIYDTGMIDIALHCISNNSEIVFSVGEDTLDVFGSRVTPTTTLPIGAVVDVANPMVYQATAQMLDVLVSFHSPGAAGNPVESIQVYSQQSAAGQGNQCFASAHAIPYFGP